MGGGVAGYALSQVTETSWGAARGRRAEQRAGVSSGAVMEDRGPHWHRGVAGAGKLVSS